MDSVRRVFEQLKARYATDIKRANEAESRLHEVQEINEERRKQAQDLQTRLDLTRQHNTLMKQLLVVLPKLEEAKNKLAILTDKSDKFDVKMQSILAETDAFEVQYRKSKKQYDELLYELDSLGIN